LWGFIIWIIDFIIEFWEILEYLLKNRHTLNTKEFQRLLFAFFLFFNIFDILFSILPVYSFKKN